MDSDDKPESDELLDNIIQFPDRGTKRKTNTIKAQDLYSETEEDKAREDWLHLSSGHGQFIIPNPEQSQDNTPKGEDSEAGAWLVIQVEQPRVQESDESLIRKLLNIPFNYPLATLAATALVIALMRA